MSDKQFAKLVWRICDDEAFQASCRRYSHANGSSDAIAACALRAAIEVGMVLPPTLAAEGEDA